MSDETKVNESSLRSYQLATSITGGEVMKLFTFQPWTEEQITRGQMVRDTLAIAFKAVVDNVPPSPTRTRALNGIIDARMLANAAITFEGKL